MPASIRAVNAAGCVISVYADDAPIFLDIIPGEATTFKNVAVGTRRLMVFSERGKLLYDLWVSASERHTLKIYDRAAVFT